MFLSAIHWDIDPALIELGALQIRYYGLLWAGSFFIGYLIVKKMFLAENKKEELLDPLLYTLLISAILGARLGHVFFYDWGYYSEHLSEIPKIWEGGLASHGGAIGILIGVWWYAKKYMNGNFLWVLDRLVIPIALAGAFIRFGNFLNSEIVGKPTGSDWGVVFVRLGENFPRHPAQLYEAFCYAVIFFLLFWMYKKKPIMRSNGKLLGVFLTLVFIARFLIEFVKKSQGGFEDSIGLSLSTGQLLSIPFVLVGVYFWFLYKKPSVT